MVKSPRFTVTAAQMAPIQNDTDATIEKAGGFVREAARKGAKVIAFPEAIVPGYPW